MRLKSLSISNFRGIGGPQETTLDCGQLNLIVGDNGTSKTSILEALNFCLSPIYLANRLSIDDFYKGLHNEISIGAHFDEEIDVKITDGYHKRTIKCNSIQLRARKREKAAGGKILNDLVTSQHFFLPVSEKTKDGWLVTRNNGKNYYVSEVQLSVNQVEASIPRVFYFGKDRNRQLKRGFNSTFSNVVDDLNWRFEKSQRALTQEEHFHAKRVELEEKAKYQVGDSLKKTIERANDVLREDFGISDIDLSLIKTLSPFDNSEIVKRIDSLEIPISSSGSGIEMIASLVFLETISLFSKEKIILLIDEPELHLHPKFQSRLASHLQEISKSFQVFVSTHSPFFFKDLIKQSESQIFIAKKKNELFSIEKLSGDNLSILPWGPTWGEVCYFAYEMPTTEFHDELFSAVQDKFQLESISEVDRFFLSRGHESSYTCVHSNNGKKINETLMTFVRNKMHHPENNSRHDFTMAQLKESINILLEVLRD